MSRPDGQIGMLRDEEQPAVRVIVPPDPSDPTFDDDIDPGEIVFDRDHTPMLVYEPHPSGRRGRLEPTWVLWFERAPGDTEPYPIPGGLGDLEDAVRQARDYLWSETGA